MRDEKRVSGFIQKEQRHLTSKSQRSINKTSAMRPLARSHFTIIACKGLRAGTGDEAGFRYRRSKAFRFFREDEEEEEMEDRANVRG